MDDFALPHFSPVDRVEELKQWSDVSVVCTNRPGPCARVSKRPDMIFPALGAAIDLVTRGIIVSEDAASMLA